MRYLIAKLVCHFAGHDLMLERDGKRCRRCGEFEPVATWDANAYLITIPEGEEVPNAQEVAQGVADTVNRRTVVLNGSETVTAHPMCGRKKARRATYEL